MKLKGFERYRATQAGPVENEHERSELREIRLRALCHLRGRTIGYLGECDRDQVASLLKALS